MNPFDEPTRAVNPDEMFRTGGPVRDDEQSNTLEFAGRPSRRPPGDGGAKRPPPPPPAPGAESFDEDPTRAIDVKQMAARQAPQRKKIRYPNREEATRAVDLDRYQQLREEGMSDVDWDLD